MALRDLLRVPVGGPVDLAGTDPGSTPGVSPDVAGTPKEWARARVDELGDRLAELQERLYAAAKVGAQRRRVLLVVQAMDCGGKDGMIKHVIGRLNPQGVRIASFGVPTPDERKHHFLWRIRRALPEPGYIGVFNRSHYEDVLVPRVHGLVPAGKLQRRIRRINRFEDRLVGDGCTVLKVMLHISPDEQLHRLLRRLDDPTKRWKYQPSDVDERRHWSAYQEAYRDVLRETSTVRAPWHVVPADHKWYRDWAVAHLLHETLVELDPRYPEPAIDLEAEKARLGATRTGAAGLGARALSGR